jgi:putative nucleotidyltransferase with HDIG domain
MREINIQTPHLDGVQTTHEAAPLQSDQEDPVLAALRVAEDLYLSERGGVDRIQTALADARYQLTVAERRLDETRAESQGLQSRLRETEGNLDAAHAQAAAERERARRLAEALRQVHRAVFGGSVYEHLLRACLSLTGATRGLYLTIRGRDENMRARAAVDIDNYPKAPPSEYIKALARHALDSQDTLVVNAGDYRPDLPKPEDPSEQFANLVVAPVALQNGLDGVVIVTDKTHGDFEEQDVQMLVAVGSQAAVAIENHQLRQELQGAYLTTITVLADAVEAKDAYTAGHCERVARYARAIGEVMGLSARDLSVVYCGGLLHDVGKIGVSDGLLNKPGLLLPEERELVHSHVRVGHDLVSKVTILKAAADAVLYHHEWFDGSGYPDGLRGDEIPLTARIVSVADSYSAMVDRRSYKEPLSPERARAELERCAGIQFDPQVVEAFCKVLDRGDLHQHEDEDLGFGPLLGVAQPPRVRQSRRN